MPVYIIIGTHKPSCRELIEQAAKERLDDLLPEPWKIVSGAAELSSSAGEVDSATLFCILDPSLDLADEIESVQTWSRRQDKAVDRVIGVIDTAAAEQSKTYARWAEACAHFSDAVVWANRDPSSQKWLRAFQKHFDKLCLPCSYHLLKKGGRVDDPRLLFFPETRRLSPAFDPVEEDSSEKDPLDPANWIEIDASFDLNDSDSEADSEDPWLARHESGHRKQRLPSIDEWIVD